MWQSKISFSCGKVSRACGRADWFKLIVTSDPVYATNKTLLADGVGRRLENFFWRIWSNADIRHHIRGSQVAFLFSKISEGGFLRTTPTQSPRTSRSLGSYRQTSCSGSALDSSPPNARATSSRPQRSSSGAAEEKRRNMGALDDPASRVSSSFTAPRLKKEVSLPPSILKKSRAESSSQLSKSSTIVSPTFDPLRRNPCSGSGEVVISVGSPLADATVTGRGDRSSHREQLSSRSRDEKKPSVSSSKSKTPPAEARVPEGKNSRLPGDDQKATRTKPAVHAKTGASRRRPVMASRKSSQSSSSNASNVISPPSSGKKVASSGEPPDSNLDADARSRRKAQLAKSSRPGSPHPSKHGAQESAEESSSSDEEAENDADSGKNRLDDSLVDRDFRSKFASRLRPEPQLAGSLPPLECKPAQASADSVPYKATSTTRIEQAKQRNGKSKRNVGFTDEIIPLKPPGAAAEEDESETPGDLPRTKSQLTLLLEQDRRKSRGDNTPKKGGRR